jgi:HlyD family secretion protein
MTMRRRSVVVLLAAGLALAACTGSNDNSFQGWVEADLIFVSPDESGRVETLSVREGDTVTQGSPLFTVDAELQQADVAMAQASVTNARQAFDRAQTLVKTQAGTQRAFDEAEAALRTAEARLNSAQTRLVRRKVSSPVTGAVQQIYYRPGEMVPAGRPVVALLPPGNIKIRFFIPEPTLPRISLGETVTIRCDGCRSDLSARVSFISRSSEFTPPVIYSQEERAKLVFMIEARTTTPEALRVGQPVTVVLQPSQSEPKR